MQTQTFDLVRQALLEPSGIGNGELEQVMGRMLGAGVDYADLYFQYARHESWALEEGEVKSASRSIEQGVGARAISGEKTGFAYSDDLVAPALLEAATSARAIARSAGGAVAVPWKQGPVRALYQGLDPLASLDDAAKVQLLERVEREARAQDPRVKQVMASLSGTYEQVLVLRSDGVAVADVRPLVRLNVTVILEDHGRREQGSAGGGGRSDYGLFIAEEQGLRYAREAVRQALVNLDAKPAPAGEMTVVLGPGWPGILLHEAIGHGLEGDFNRKGTSAFSNCLGQRVASEQCTVVDDGTLPGRRGSLNVDDEGTPTQQTVLIEKGILKGYLQDRLNARLMGHAPTGNGRRESYAHLPMPRMTNTYMLAGTYDPAEIIRSVDRGLYAANFGGGQVDITSGKFVFSASEAYLIENGRITAPVRGATLIGNGPDVLTRVSMAGRDMELDWGVGTCGKEGQSVPVGVGQPTLRIDGLTVGGTEG
ncbi:MAG TPA: metalloprotease TldD [Acidiferrobacteraceae bacterium]|nr:metalloprotease TldD [Acidiferrobacteraceae bacterium]